MVKPTQWFVAALAMVLAVCAAEAGAISEAASEPGAATQIEAARPSTAAEPLSPVPESIQPESTPPESARLEAAGAIESTEPQDGPRTTLRSGREASLAGILTARRQLQADLLALQERLRSDGARGREREIEGKIRELSQELDDLSRSFSELSSGVDPYSVELGEQQDELNLTNEVRDLVGPLINELKRATSRPREIDRLRTEISDLQERLNNTAFALSRIDKLSASIGDPTILSALEAEKADWLRRQSALRTSLQVAQQKLGQRLGETQSIAQAVENLFQLFFKSRGRNLTLALLAMLAFLYGLRRLRTFLAQRPGLSQRAESFEGRIVSLIYSAFTFIGAILVFLVALYFFGDWVLLILMLLLILGIIWTSKQAIPRFWSQAVLILDMGPVREGERVLYRELPWHVETISFYSILVNPLLTGGALRLPIDDLAELRSRPYEQDEPWFPTRAGDVVLMPDGRPGEVEFQSIEAVRLRHPGGSRTILPTSDFSSQAIEKLSDGYRVDIQFGLDYGDQAEITTTMRDLLQRRVEERWIASGWGDALAGASVEFKEAGASSLDYFVRVDLDGSTAFDIQAQKRFLARICVDVCNEQGWVIPFTQLTLHVAANDGHSHPSPAAD